MKSKKFKPVKLPTNFDKLIKRLKVSPIELEELFFLLKSFDDTFFEDPNLELELLLSNGLPLEITDNIATLKTLKTKIKDQVFCVVDIETNNSNPHKGQIIEIGAVKYKNGEIIDSYESLVYAKHIPEYIQEVTKITPKMLENAPPLNQVLEEFKIFLEDDVFVAHDIKFDYKFISESFKKFNLGELKNRKLCTIDLAKRTIEAQRYGLDFLKELLNINIENHHRAYSDALSTSFILGESLSKLKPEVITTEDLIDYSKSDNIIVKPNQKPREEKVNV